MDKDTCVAILVNDQPKYVGYLVNTLKPNRLMWTDDALGEFNVRILDKIERAEYMDVEEGEDHLQRIFMHYLKKMMRKYRYGNPQAPPRERLLQFVETVDANAVLKRLNQVNQKTVDKRLKTFERIVRKLLPQNRTPYRKLKSRPSAVITHLGNVISPLLGKKLRMLRLGKGWTGPRLAQEAGLTTQSPKQRIHEIETCKDGRGGIKLGSLYAFAFALGVEVTELLPPKEDVLDAATLRRVKTHTSDTYVALTTRKNTTASCHTCRQSWMTLGEGINHTQDTDHKVFADTNTLVEISKETTKSRRLDAALISS